MSNTGWIGVDLDGTLAHYDGWKGAGHIGEPVPAMLERVKRWLAEGREVRIFTARVSCPELPLVNANNREARQARERRAQAYEAKRAIQAWCERHLGQRLNITNVKDYDMVALWDDRAVQVIKNTGEPLL